MSTSPARHKRNPSSGHGRSRWGLGFLMVACSLLVATGATASAASKTVRSPASLVDHASSTVKPDFAYFRGKTINLVNWGSIGGVPYYDAEALAPYMAAYLHATVNVETIAGGGTLIGQNEALSQSPNGLTIGMLNPAGDIGGFVTNTPGIVFSLRATPILGGLPPTSQVVIATPASGLTSFKQMVNSKTPISVIAEAGGSGQVYESLMFGGFHVANKFLYGYSSSAAELAGFVRGDGEVVVQAYSVFQSLVLAHQGNVLLVTAPALKGEVGYSILRRIPTLEQYAAANPPKTKDQRAEVQMLETLFALPPNPFVVPVGTPAKLQAALRDAMQFAATRGGATAQLLKVGLPNGYIQPDTIKRSIDAVIGQQSKLEAWLKATGAPPAG